MFFFYLSLPTTPSNVPESRNESRKVGMGKISHSYFFCPINGVITLTSRKVGNVGHTFLTRQTMFVKFL